MSKAKSLLNKVTNEALDIDKAIDLITDYRNKMVDLKDEGVALAKKLKSIKGSFMAVDEEGDSYDEFDNVGDAFDATNSIDSAVGALYQFVNGVLVNASEEGSTVKGRKK